MASYCDFFSTENFYLLIGCWPRRFLFFLLNPPTPHARRRSATLRYKIDYYFNPTEKVICTVTVEHCKYKLYVYIHYGRSIGINFSKLGSNYQIVTNPAKVIFGYENPYIFSYIILYSTKVSSTPIQTDWYHFRCYRIFIKWVGEFWTIEIFIWPNKISSGWNIDLKVASWSSWNFA